MNIRKLARKVKEFLSADDRKRKEKRKFLKHVLKKLQKHEKTLVENLKTVSDEEERAELESEIALTHAQRKKGIAKLEELKKSKKKK